VISHPETGSPTLFVNPGFAIRFEGLSDSESRLLIDEITEHATSEDNIYRHRWQKHDIVMWDNFSTMHMATGGYQLPMRRVMHRLTVGGYDLEPAIST
jgi:taurine dioxygenase